MDFLRKNRMLMKETVILLLKSLYPGHEEHIWKEIEKSASKYGLNGTGGRSKFSEKDCFLITYPDSVKKESEVSLKTLYDFLTVRYPSLFSYVHILPFYPYSSDDGFSVMDYYSVNPDVGNWDDISNISKTIRIMFDAVINHVSAKGKWFANYMNQEEGYDTIFIEKDDSFDTSNVIRPRTSPLFTKFGDKELWTTFSADQVDLNYKSPDTIIKVLDVLLFYVSKGASTLRLDAVSYMWKKSGTTSSCLEECHMLIKLIRAVLDSFAPYVTIITETNVKHEENVKFLSDGKDEAQMVYQFALPPLVAFSYLSQSAEKLTTWASSLVYKNEMSYFNFLSSHDGIGIVPVSEILSEEERALLVSKTIEKGGRVSKKSLPDGSETPYELNIVYKSLLPTNDAFVSSMALLLALKGIPAIYYVSLLASDNDTKVLAEGGSNRSINREKFSFEKAKALSNKEESVKIEELIKLRKSIKAFSPDAQQYVLSIDPRLFCIERKKDEISVLCIFSFADSKIRFIPENGYKAISGNYEEQDAEFLINEYGYLYLEKRI